MEQSRRGYFIPEIGRDRETGLLHIGDEGRWDIDDDDKIKVQS